jgi:hypothetical protein
MTDFLLELRDEDRSLRAITVFANETNAKCKYQPHASNYLSCAIMISFSSVVFFLVEAY